MLFIEFGQMYTVADCQVKELNGVNIKLTCRLVVVLTLALKTIQILEIFYEQLIAVTACLKG